MTRGITQEQSESIKRDLCDYFKVGEDEVFDRVAKLLATEIKISPSSSNDFNQIISVFENNKALALKRFEIDGILNKTEDSALIIFANIANKLVYAKDGKQDLESLKKHFGFIANNPNRTEEETAKMVLEAVSNFSHNVEKSTSVDDVIDAFENSFTSNEVESEISQEDIDLMSEASEEIDLMSETSEEMDEAETLFDDDEIQTTRTDKSLEEKNNVKTTQDDQDLEEAKKKLEEDFKAAENQKKQEEIKAEEEKKFKKDFCNNSTEKPKEKKSLWQRLKEGVEDASTNKIPRAIGAVILGDFAALSVGGALGGPVGVAVVYLFWELTKDSKEVKKSVEKSYDVNAEANEYKKEREEIRKNYRAETSAGKAASQVEAETIKEMEEQKDELKSSKNTISGVREMDEVKKVAQSLRASGVSEHEEDDNKTVVSVNNEPKGLGR